MKKQKQTKKVEKKNQEKKVEKKSQEKKIKKNNQEKKEKTIIIGKFKLSLEVLDLIIVGLLVVIYVFSPRVYSVTTGLYNQSTAENQKNVETAMGAERTEERFRLYFQWYNVIHELGHGLLYYNNGVKLPVADEEQLVNDFAVAYWKYYGEEEKVSELKDIVDYAVKNVGTNYINGVDYLALGKENSNGKSFYDSFFNFNDYGWFQFSSVKHSFETDKSLKDVLAEMGFENFDLGERKTLAYSEINEDSSTKVINDAVENFRNWGLKYPDATHHFDKDPNNNYSRAMVKYLGLIEFPDFVYVFKSLF